MRIPESKHSLGKVCSVDYVKVPFLHLISGNFVH